MVGDGFDRQLNNLHDLIKRSAAYSFIPPTSEDAQPDQDGHPYDFKHLPGRFRRCPCRIRSSRRQRAAMAPRRYDGQRFVTQLVV
jgi:hypothetical protein